MGRPAAADEMKIDFPTGSAVYLIPTYCTEEEDEEEERRNENKRGKNFALLLFYNSIDD